MPFAALQTAQPLTAALHTTLHGGATHCLARGSRLPFATLQTPKRSAAALQTVLWGLQDCRLPTFKRVNPPQRPYTLCCWGVQPFAALQTRQPSTATLHILLVVVPECPGPASAPEPFFQTVTLSQRPYRLSCRGFKSAVCRPSIGSTLRSGPTQHSLVQTAQTSAAALHTVLLKARDFIVDASRLPFASLPTPYTLSSWGCKSAP